ncbi:MAG: hypothetical protein NTZ39_11690 [Methanoregula sp.]|nr:hypothetical protein [Methanoregula sp.]
MALIAMGFSYAPSLVCLKETPEKTGSSVGVQEFRRMLILGRKYECDIFISKENDYGVVNKYAEERNPYHGQYPNDG